MSNFENPLNNFHTYSFYHVLVACSTTQAAEALFKNNAELLDVVRSTQSIEEKYSVKGITDAGGVVSPDNINRVGKYIILFNGATDAEFVISSVKWNSLMYPAEGTDSYTTLSSEGQIEIIEPNGARFLNLINNSVRKLGVDSTGIVYVLKTVFVGNGYDGSLSASVINNIPPLMFLMLDISAYFETIGGTYTLSFMSLTNGAAKLVQFNQAPQALSSLALRDGSTLVDALNDFNVKLNNLYNEHVKNVLASSNNESTDFKYIYYLIYYDDIYNDGKKYKVDLFKDQTAATSVGENIVSFGESATIESALNEIMKHCSGVIDDGNGVSKSDNTTTNNKVKYGYKIVSSLESTEDTILAIYRIVRYPLPTSSIIEKALNGDLEDEALKNNAITFDYMWTGKNKDILEFDIKMAHAMTFLSMITSTDNLADSSTNNNIPGQCTPSSNNSLTGEKPNEKIKTVMYFPKANEKNSSRNTKKPASSMKFNELLSRFAALEGLDTRITIRGNPIFLANLSSLPSAIRKEPTGILDKKEFSNFERVPALCKINIKMPQASIHPGRNDMGIDQYEDFWYKGYYYIYNIENIFDGSGEFKQVLDMLSLPKDFNFTEADEPSNNKDTTNTTQQSLPTEQQDQQNAAIVANAAKGK